MLLLDSRLCSLESASSVHTGPRDVPFPPKPVSNESAVKVSPGSGMRGVRVMKSMFRDPITAIVGILKVYYEDDCAVDKTSGRCLEFQSLGPRSTFIDPLSFS